ncbi:MAG TPA: Uma2 family endonuclease [Pyrinomonadaceae bacterium]|nr:Uma2 family endonuclease [Pyrinomonadaceae bacterium]
MSVQLERYHFTTRDFYRMLEAGILTEDDRVELINGEVLEMTPTGSRHAGHVLRLSTLFTECFGRSALINVQNPVRLDDFSEPLPDISVLKPRADFYSEAHPTPAGVLLIAEVADSSIQYDTRVKVPLYAQAGIPEVWVVNLNEDVLEVYAQPEQGAYSFARRFRRGEEIASSLPGAQALKVAAVLG